MGNFKAFLKGNVKETENFSLKLDRFDEAIILRPLAAKEADAINEHCFKNKAGKKGKQERVFDSSKYNRDICVASVVYPDLHNAELQESYGVKGADNLYAKMFYLGEANQILETVTEVSGFESSIDEEIEEAKN